jgi:hypothetical protein
VLLYEDPELCKPEWRHYQCQALLFLSQTIGLYWSVLVWTVILETNEYCVWRCLVEALQTIAALQHTPHVEDDQGSTDDDNPRVGKLDELISHVVWLFQTREGTMNAFAIRLCVPYLVASVIDNEPQSCTSSSSRQPSSTNIHADQPVSASVSHSTHFRDLCSYHDTCQGCLGPMSCSSGRSIKRDPDLARVPVSTRL